MSSAGLIVVADIHGLTGRTRELRALLDELAAGSLTEPGCLGFRVLDAELAGDFVLLEAFTDEAALRAHHDTPHYHHYRALVGQFLATPSDVVVHHLSQTVRPIDPNLPDPTALG